MNTFVGLVGVGLLVVAIIGHTTLILGFVLDLVMGWYVKSNWPIEENEDG